MGIFSEYMDRIKTPEDLEKERKKQLLRIAHVRGNRAILSYASAMMKPGPVSIDYDDRIAVFDQLSNLTGDEIDIILETPGGSAEIVEDIVKVIRKRFHKVGMIVPGYAKSAGTIMVMAGDEILMQPSSSLGPIDAQIIQSGKRYSAHAFLEGFKKIKEEVASGKLNHAYVPILQMISPGELQSCENALEFAKRLVTSWLSEYKFKFWDIHSSTGKPVSEEDKKKRASDIADDLCNHGKWLSHGRSITIDDLRGMRLIITDYSGIPDLYDAINRYYTLLLMSLAVPDVIKIIETPGSQISKRLSIPGQPAPRKQAEYLSGQIVCPKCKTQTNVQINFRRDVPLLPTTLLFPADNMFECPVCHEKIDLTDYRGEIEKKYGKIVT